MSFFRKIFGLSEPSKFKEQTPAFIKLQEVDRINPFYSNITIGRAPDENVKLVASVPYIWIYTDKKEVIMGVEEPWKFPNAILADADNPLALVQFNHSMVDPKESPEPLGHPTLAAAFTKKGAAEPQTGRAFIGGTLIRIEHRWQLNNISGRFGIIENDIADAFELMHTVADEISKVTLHNERPQIKLTLPDFPFLANYYLLWNRFGDNINEVSDVIKALRILNDYIHLGNPFPTEHMPVGRTVKRTIDKFKHKDPNYNHTVQDVLMFLQAQLEGTGLPIDDSLLLRMRFLAGQTRSALDLSHIPHHEGRITEDPLVRAAERRNDLRRSPR